MLKETFYLPIKLRPVTISQGWHGPFSHYAGWVTIDLSHAVDFAVPWGTVVYAAAAGVVEPLDFWGEWYGGDEATIGAKARSNLAIVRHGSGLISVYSHLETGSVSQRWHRGERVGIGEEIGITGRSGWVPQHCPHLHFQVLQDLISVPYSFVDYSGPLEDAEIRKR